MSKRYGFLRRIINQLHFLVGPIADRLFRSDSFDHRYVSFHRSLSSPVILSHNELIEEKMTYLVQLHDAVPTDNHKLWLTNRDDIYRIRTWQKNWMASIPYFIKYARTIDDEREMPIWQWTSTFSFFCRHRYKNSLVWSKYLRTFDPSSS